MRPHVMARRGSSATNAPDTTGPDAYSALLARIRDIWVRSRTQAARSVNSAHVCANWLSGQQIVEADQGGARRAGYGLALLRTLSARLTTEFGDGFSLTALKQMRSFYLGYPRLLEKGHALRDLLADNAADGASTPKGHAACRPKPSCRTSCGASWRGS